MKNPTISTPQLQSSDLKYQGFFSVTVDTLLLPDGTSYPYTVMQLSSDAISILAQTTDGKWLINQEFRYPAQEWLLSAPGGLVHPSEDPLTAAQRELLEETGYCSDEWSILGSIYPFPAFTKQKIFFVLATNAYFKQPPQLEPLERIKTHLFTDQELTNQIAANSAVDGVLCTALYLKNLHNKDLP